MSEQEEKPTPSQNITSNVKEKDPKRVEAGRKLGMNSAKSKEAKRKKLEEYSSDYSPGFVALAAGALVVGGTIAYYLLTKKDTADPPATKVVTPEVRSKRYLED